MASVAVGSFAKKLRQGVCCLPRQEIDSQGLRTGLLTNTVESARIRGTDKTIDNAAMAGGFIVASGIMIPCEVFFIMKRLAFLLTILLAFLLTGCFALPVEAPMLPPPAFAQPVEHEFYTVPVMRGNIELEANPFAVYRPARTERHRFVPDDIPVLGIFVSVGDEVLQGDIIAELDLAEVRQELEDLSRSHARLNFELDLLRERHNLAIRLARESGRAVNDASFVASRNSLHADLELLEQLLGHVEQLNEQRYLRAIIDGTVIGAATFVEGLHSSTVMDVVTVSNQAFMSFSVRGEMAQLMNPGDQFEMTLGNEIFTVEVVDPYVFGFSAAYETEEERDPEAFLAFVGALTPQAHNIPTQGRVRIPLEEVYDVLYIPVSFLRRYDERDFVYVYIDGLRTVRDVVAGLEADGVIEIISGLEEGELIIQ